MPPHPNDAPQKAVMIEEQYKNEESEITPSLSAKETPMTSPVKVVKKTSPKLSQPKEEIKNEQNERRKSRGG